MSKSPENTHTLADIRQWAVLRGHQRGVRSVLFSLDDKMIASADGQEIRFWVRSSNTTFRLKHIMEASAEKLAFAPDGRFLVSCGGRRSIQWWTREGDWIENMPGDERDMAFSPDGTLFVTGDNYGRVKLWDVETRDLLYTFQQIPDLKQINYENPVGDFAFSLDGQ